MAGRALSPAAFDVASLLADWAAALCVLAEGAGRGAVKVRVRVALGPAAVGGWGLLGGWEAAAALAAQPPIDSLAKRGSILGGCSAGRGHLLPAPMHAMPELDWEWEGRGRPQCRPH